MSKNTYYQCTRDLILRPNLYSARTLGLQCPKIPTISARETYLLLRPNLYSARTLGLCERPRKRPSARKDASSDGDKAKLIRIPAPTPTPTRTHTRLSSCAHTHTCTPPHTHRYRSRAQFSLNHSLTLSLSLAHMHTVAASSGRRHRHGQQSVGHEEAQSVPQYCSCQQGGGLDDNAQHPTCHMRRRMHACHMRRRIHTWMITPNTGRDVNAIPTRDMAFTVGITTIFTDALSSGSTAALATSPADEQMASYSAVEVKVLKRSQGRQT